MKQVIDFFHLSKQRILIEFIKFPKILDSNKIVAFIFSRRCFMYYVFFSVVYTLLYKSQYIGWDSIYLWYIDVRDFECNFYLNEDVVWLSNFMHVLNANQ